jgi:hypothetical protein
VLRFTGNATGDEFDAAVAGVTHWYHSFAFDNGYRVRGDYNIAANVDEYGFGNVAGLEVLDIGAASGWFTFYLEQQGATVTTFDLTSPEQLDTFGRYQPPTDPGFDAEWVKGAIVMGDLLGSRVERAYGRIYELPAVLAGRSFDLVLMGALLLHLRDPIGALMAARAVCRNRLLATNWFAPDNDLLAGINRPAADLPSLGAEEQGRYSWWRPNRAAYRLWFEAAGFRDVDVGRTVTLTADLEVADHFNSTQALLLGDARV